MQPDPPLIVAVNPYHLTTRETPSMASLLLADHVVTFMPSPGAGSEREHVEEAVRRSPRYLRFMESWRWAVPLWRLGVIRSAHEGDDLSEDVRAVRRRIMSDDALSPLRALMHPERARDEDSYLDALSADLLKGGPDPGMSIPVAAAVDRFASRHGIASARSAPTSVAQRAEVRLGRRAFSVALPVLVQASAERILEARRALEPVLRAVRAAVVRAGDADESEQAECAETLEAAARAYAAAFADWRARPIEAEPSEPRIMDSFVSVTGVSMPVDAVLLSSMAAARSMGAAGGPARAAGVSGGDRVLSLLFKAMNVRPHRATA